MRYNFFSFSYKNYYFHNILKNWETFLQAIIVSCCGCFHGRTLAVISMSCDNDATRGFGPLLPGNLKVDFGDADSLEKIFKRLKMLRSLIFTREFYFRD